MRKLLSGLVLAFVLFLSFSTPAFANCDGWASEGSEHRNAGNGCSYRCEGGSWRGPNRCDGQGNGVCQGCGNASQESQARAVAQSQAEAARKVAEQGTAVTNQIAQQTATQRSQEANVQAAMVEEQRQRALANAQTAEERAAINQRAEVARASVAAASGVALSTLTGQATQVAGTGTATANGTVQSCDPNSGVAGTVSAGGTCCRGGVNECGENSNGSCNAPVDRTGTVGYCGTIGSADITPKVAGTQAEIAGDICYINGSAAQCVNGKLNYCVSFGSGSPVGRWQKSNDTCSAGLCVPSQIECVGTNALRACSSSGGAYLDTVQCAAGTTCYRGRCADRRTGTAGCTSGETMCQNGRIFNCVSVGNGVPYGNWQSTEQSCVETRCTASQVTCTGHNTFNICNPRGTGENQGTCREGWQCINGRGCVDVSTQSVARSNGEFCDIRAGSENSAGPGESCCVGGINECRGGGNCQGDEERVGRCVGGTAAPTNQIANSEQATNNSTCGGPEQLACGGEFNPVCDSADYEVVIRPRVGKFCRLIPRAVTTQAQAAENPSCGQSGVVACGTTRNICDPGLEPNAQRICALPQGQITNSAQAESNNDCGGIGQPACGGNTDICDRNVPNIRSLAGECFITNTAVASQSDAVSNPYCGGNNQNACGDARNWCDDDTLEKVGGRCILRLGSSVNSPTQAANTSGCGASGERTCNGYCDIAGLEPNRDGICAPHIADPGSTHLNEVTTYTSNSVCDAMPNTRACRHTNGQWACVNENEFPETSSSQDSSRGCERWAQNLRAEGLVVDQSVMDIREGEYCPDTQTGRRGAQYCRCTFSDGYTLIIASGNCEASRNPNNRNRETSEEAVQQEKPIVVQAEESSDLATLAEANGACETAPCQCPDGSTVTVDGGFCDDAVSATVQAQCSSANQRREDSTLGRCCQGTIPVTNRVGNETQTICQSPDQVSNITQNFEEQPVLCGDSQGCNCVNTIGVQYATVGFGVSCPVPDDTGSMAQHPLCTGATVRLGTRMSSPCQIPPIAEFSESTGIAGQCQTGFRANADGTACEPLNFIRAAQSFLCSINPNLPECAANPSGQYLSNRGVCPEGATCVCVGGKMNGNTCETFQTLGIREVCSRDDTSLCHCPSGEMGVIDGVDVCLPRENGNACFAFQPGTRCIDGYRFECQMGNFGIGTLVTNAETCQERQCPSGQFRCNSETQSAFCREDGSEWVPVNCADGFVCNADTNNRCADRRPLAIEGNQCNLIGHREYATHLDVPQCGANNYICQYGQAIQVTSNGQRRWVCPDPTGEFNHGCPEGQLYDDQSASCNEFGMPACAADRRVNRGTTYSRECHEGTNDDSYSNCPSGMTVREGRCFQPPINVIATEVPIVEEATPVEPVPPENVWVVIENRCVSCNMSYLDWAALPAANPNGSTNQCYGKAPYPSLEACTSDNQ